MAFQLARRKSQASLKPRGFLLTETITSERSVVFITSPCRLCSIILPTEGCSVRASQHVCLILHLEYKETGECCNQMLQTGKSQLRQTKQLPGSTKHKSCTYTVLSARISPMSFISFLFLVQNTRKPGHPADNVNSPLYLFFLLNSHLITQVSAGCCVESTLWMVTMSSGCMVLLLA